MEYDPFDQWFGPLFCHYLNTIELSPQKAAEIWQEICRELETAPPNAAPQPAALAFPNRM